MLFRASGCSTSGVRLEQRRTHQSGRPGLGQFVAPGTAGLDETRGIVDEGATILVGGEGSGAIYRFNASTGAFVGTLVSGMSRPTGMALDADGSLLVLWGNRVRRYNRSTGAALGILASGVDGGISGGTFLALVPNPQLETISERIDRALKNRRPHARRLVVEKDKCSGSRAKEHCLVSQRELQALLPMPARSEQTGRARCFCVVMTHVGLRDADGCPDTMCCRDRDDGCNPRCIAGARRAA